MRVMIIFKLIRNELNRLSHPRAIERIKINGNPLDDTAVKSVLIFFALYILSIALGTLVLTTPDIDLETTFSATISCISNIGPALGMLGPTHNFSIFNDFDLTVLSFLMLYGRLEIFTILLLFMPKFWR
jgi:trk system potassium uptake protein TrkH